jgi:hypothetical protein
MPAQAVEAVKKQAGGTLPVEIVMQRKGSRAG